MECGITRLIKAFIINRILSTYLQVCLALEFDLVKKPAPKMPFMVHIDVGLEPSNITILFRLYASMYRDSEPEEIEGMLQINAVTPLHPSITPHPHCLKAWCEVCEELCGKGQASTPVVIVKFISNGIPEAFSCPLPISPAALTIVKENHPFECLSALTGPSSTPMSATACLESVFSHCTPVVATELTMNSRFINTFIHLDTQNQLLLHMNMREEDRETI